MVSREALRNGMKGRWEIERRRKRVMCFWAMCEKIAVFSGDRKPFEGAGDPVMTAI